MIHVLADADSNRVSIWLQADRALGWTETARHLRLHLLLTLGLGAGFVSLGFWPIAIYLLLASALLAAASWCTLRRLAWRECITITREQIRLQRGRRQPQQEQCCARSCVRLRILRGATPWHEPTVLLDCAGLRWELGHDLVASERRRLIRLLGAAGLAESAQDAPPWDVV